MAGGGDTEAGTGAGTGAGAGVGGGAKSGAGAGAGTATGIRASAGSSAADCGGTGDAGVGAGAGAGIGAGVGGGGVDKEGNVKVSVVAGPEEVGSIGAAPSSGGVAAPSPKPSQERRRGGDGMGVRGGGVRPGSDVRRKIRPA